MFKKLLGITLAIAASIAISSPSKAADVYQTIDVIGYQYPHIEFYPKAIYVNQGDNLHLTVRNTRISNARLYIPGFNLDQDIWKGHVAKFDLCIASPYSKDLWFSNASISGKREPGYIVVNNFRIPPTQLPSSRIIDTSSLNTIINYNKDYCYQPNQPLGGAAPIQHKKPVRGYW